MQIELRSVTHNARLSRETSCFTADIWIDGVKRGTVENDGGGGANIVRPHSLSVELEAHAKTLPKIKTSYSDEPFEQDADLMIGTLLDEHLTAKRLARMFKTKVVFVRDGRAYTGKAAPAGCKVLNDLPIADAVRAFLACG